MGRLAEHWVWAVLGSGLLIVACRQTATRIPAELGDPDAQARLGWMYLKGDDVPRDYAKALVWTKKAADQGQANAMDNLSRPGQ